MYSRIFGEARKKGLVYGIFSDVVDGPTEGAWDFGGEVNYDTAADLFAIIAREVKSVLNGHIRSEEVEAAKLYALGRYQMGAQTVAQINGFYSNRYFNDEVIDDYARVPESIKRISLDDIVATARCFVQADTWALVAVGNCEKRQLVDLSRGLEQLYGGDGSYATT
jgi:predicted Zn-dependent peptidase